MIFIGPYIRTREPADGWGLPPGVSTSIDLAPLAEQGQLKGDHRPVGVFWGDKPLSSDWSLLGEGDPRDVRPGKAVRDAFWGHARIRPEGDTLAAMIADCLIGGSDPQGEAGPLPLVLTCAGRLEVHAGGLIHSEVFRWGEHRHTNRLQAMLKRQLAAVRNDAYAGRCRTKSGVDPEFHRRRMTALCERYGVEWEHLRPAAWDRAETPLPHSTTITESFNTGDSDTLGPDLSWTELSGDADVVSNQCKFSVATTIARADADLSSDDHYCQFSFVGPTPGNWNISALVRKDSSTTLTYYQAVLLASSSPAVYIQKRVGGANTNLGNSANLTLSLPDVLKMYADGSTLSGWWAGLKVVGDLTDTAITSNTRCGIAVYSPSVQVIIDAFEAADLAAELPPWWLFRQREFI